MTQLKSNSNVGNKKHENQRHIQLCKSIASQQYINKLDRTRRESSAILATTLAPLPIELSPTSRRMSARVDELVATPVNSTDRRCVIDVARTESCATDVARTESSATDVAMRMRGWDLIHLADDGDSAR